MICCLFVSFVTIKLRKSDTFSVKVLYMLINCINFASSKRQNDISGDNLTTIINNKNKTQTHYYESTKEMDYYDGLDGLDFFNWCVYP